MNPNLQPKQIAFDSRWPRAARIHMAGTRTSNGTVMFGKTFDAPPLVHVVCSHPDGLYRHGSDPDFGTIETLRDRVIFTMVSGYFPLTYVVVQP